jgi:hypothetical protein
MREPIFYTDEKTGEELIAYITNKKSIVIVIEEDKHFYTFVDKRLPAILKDWTEKIQLILIPPLEAVFGAIEYTKKDLSQELFQKVGTIHITEEGDKLNDQS